MVAIQKSYWMTTTGLFLIHTTHPLWIGCVPASHTSSLLLDPFWNIADCHGREERAWCLQLLLRTVQMAKPDVSGEGQQVFANSNTVDHTLHYTFPPFLWISVTLNIFQSSDIFLSFHLLLSVMKMPPGKLLFTLQDPAQIIAPSEAFYYPISYPSLKWLLSSLALTALCAYLKQRMFIVCCKCFLTFLTPRPGAVSYSFLYLWGLIQCRSHGRIEGAR